MTNVLNAYIVIHGLRNLIQNAVDFSRGAGWIDLSWSEESITVRIADDGRGYPAELLGRIGDPFVGRRRGGRDRPGYEGMGLGLFIAKTLLERTGAGLVFENGADPLRPRGSQSHGPDPRGAIVTVTWPRAALDAEAREGLGENQPHVV